MPGSPTLVAVAHGSRDPRSAATVAALLDRVRAARPGVPARLAFLDLNAPAIGQVLDSVAASGETRAVVVPLLLGSAFHARVDLPALLADAAARNPRLRLTQAEVLGADPRLLEVLHERVRTASTERGWDTAPERLGIVLAAVGSSSAAANRQTAQLARRLAARTGIPTEVCFATAEPALRLATARLRAGGADRLLVAPWFLAPGLLTDRLRGQDPLLPHAEVLGPDPALAAIVWDRYDAALARTLPLSA
ncbi:sirohydrochlorin chelatase [Nocardia jinanensis]|uniref:Cobalamin biosynthesis protein n=1 Tax=Nocardia jinanensis TaxID=382504 RepID=A0A917VQ69_9NOCA|nr:sirohydrochlorin chelatase [Nocardia jinanensis]GGL07835.1 cobalamin biosynthesis protein [Nocardia jinanensis]